MKHQPDRYALGGAQIDIQVRRNYLYEDAFEKLSPENEPNMRLRTRVELVNFAGLEEAGVDGGGIFREFLTELLKTSFDPNRGLFSSNSAKCLYPNANAKVLLEDYQKHYFFLGRLVGKAIYENMLVELPFASFFLNKILNRQGTVDLDDLSSLDPVVYKNLLYLKNYDGDVSDLNLDFTIVNNELGESQVVELVPNGRSLAVTQDNRVKYIHLVAHYRLNKQIHKHCQAFRDGIADVINLEWLRMFDHHEVQTLISGAAVPIDITDLKRHTNYSGGYHVKHDVIDLKSVV